MATIKDKRSRSGTTMFDPIVLASSTATWAINKLLDRLSNALIKALLKQEDLDKEVGDLKNALQRANLLLGAVPVGVSAGVKIENKNLEEPINKVQQLATELTKYLDELEYYDIKDKEVRYCVRGCACLAVCRRRAAVVEAREEAGARPCRPEARDTHGTVLAAPHTPAPTGGHAPRLLLLRVLWQWRPPMSTATSVLPAASGAMDGLSNFSNGLLSGSIETPVRRRGKLQRPLMKHTCLHPLLNIERLQLPLKNISGTPSCSAVYYAYSNTSVSLLQYKMAQRKLLLSTSAETKEAAAITPGSKRSTAQKSPATARIESGSSQPGKRCCLNV
ncbi:hypothetical protein U9M48_002312 [Paspalum notatum var. saurae]|uniref:Uncharacterized protein n=1 Tax=Paspalum notatum var. saurae TaxID=547442 RepID=A0AAQ3PR37_PASNO